MFATAIEDQIIRFAVAAGLPPAILLAIVEVESGGKVFALVEGRQEPIIRFEGHYFDRRLSGVKREQARTAGLAASQAGAIRNPAGQPARWKMLARAASIDRKAAYESTSWGVGQVMGAHWNWLGFASVEALVDTCRSGADGQLDLMLRYITKAGLLPALKARDWKAFARGYNGPNYAANAYDARLAAAYGRHDQRLRAIAQQAVETPSPSQPKPLLGQLFDWLRAHRPLSQG